MTRKRGQAALEFLMTYGWAILAAIIVIGVLAYFGVFSPGKYAPNACAVTAPFYCNAWNAIAADGVTIELKNNGGETYTISSVAVTNCGTGTPTNGTIAADATNSILIACSPALTVGNAFKGDIAISYTKVGSSTVLTSTGSITQKVV